MVDCIYSFLNLINRITHSGIPEEIILSFELYTGVLKSDDHDEIEAISGSTLIRRLANKYLSVRELEIYTPKNEKPKAFIGDTELSVSFSHTKSAISAAISFEYIVGCDIEHLDRKVNPSIINRIICESENRKIYDECDAIRIWTCKEAALKMIGTGLRKPMNSIRIEKISEYMFDVDYNDGKRAKICSFQHRDHWISVCFK